MKNIKTGIIIMGVLLTVGLYSCSKKCEVKIDEYSTLNSQNFQVLNPNLGVFNDGDTTKTRVVIEHLDILTALGMELVQEGWESKHQYPGIFKPYQDNDHVFQVPIEQIALTHFTLKDESKAQIDQPLQECVERFDLVLHQVETEYNEGHANGGHPTEREYILASTGELNPFPTDDSYLNTFDFESTGINLKPFLQQHSAYHLEILITFRKVPADIRVFSYSFAMAYSGNYKGKCK